MAAVGLLALAAQCGAFPYRPAAALSIVSQYAALKNPALPHTQIWKVVQEAAPDGAATLRFFLEAAPESGAVCELRIPPEGSAGEILWEAMGKTAQKKSGTGILLVPGFPVPCDILPVGQQDSGGVYQERIEAGGSVFSRSYRVSFAPVGIGEAKAAGFIRADKTGIPALTMVAVTDDRGRPVVRQLWPADGSWWLYEETPLRRSWLIY